MRVHRADDRRLGQVREPHVGMFQGLVRQRAVDRYEHRDGELDVHVPRGGDAFKPGERVPRRDANRSDVARRRRGDGHPARGRAHGDDDGGAAG